MGHNENGFFRLRDGTGWDLAAIASWENSGGPMPVLLSCQSKQFVNGRAVTVPDDITYGVGLDTAGYISNVLPRHGINSANVTYGQVEAATNDGLAAAVANER